jgi:uncharacterized small protein (DUF1192 family)
MPSIDLFGADGGRMAFSYALGCVTTFGGMVPLWKMFGVARIDELKDEVKRLEAARAEDKRDHDDERRRDREECRQETQELRMQIERLQAVLMGHSALRQAMQAAISEERVRVDQIAPEAFKIDREPKA